jgi:CRP-like cAMP-binding protein
VIQRSTPRDLRGRVNSAFFVVRDSMFVLGMALAGIADLFDVRALFLISSFALLFVGLVVLVLPGLGQPAAQWKRTWALLRGAEAAPRLGAGRIATRSDVERFIHHMPEMRHIGAKELDQLAAGMLVAEAPGGTVVVYRGEISDSAYFILSGRAAAGYLEDDEYIILNYLNAGDFFGEVAALTGVGRTANVITEEDSELLIIPSKMMQRLTKTYEGLRKFFYATMAERLNRIEPAHGISSDQGLLRELRTEPIEIEYGKSLPEMDVPRGSATGSGG